MFRDEFVVKKGFLTSAGVLFFPEKTPETHELMTIASNKVNMILFTWYLSPSVHSMVDVILGLHVTSFYNPKLKSHQSFYPHQTLEWVN